VESPHVVSFSGELDIWKEEEIDSRLAALDGSGPVRLDLSAVRYLDSAFLSALVRLRRRLPETPIEIVVDGPSVRRIFTITQLDRLFDVVPFRPE
jgi:anti-anti-sigma factor